MARQSIMIICLMVLTVFGALAFTQYMTAERERTVSQGRGTQTETTRSSGLMPRPASPAIQLGSNNYYLTDSPTGQVAFRWYGYNQDKIGIYIVRGTGIEEGSLISVKHDDGQYSFYSIQRNNAATPTAVRIN